MVDGAAKVRRFRTPCLATCLLMCAACSSPTEAHRPPTLFVTNPLCESTVCRTIQIRAFIWAYKIPQSPFGVELVGEVAGPTACLDFPEIWDIVVRQLDSEGNVVQADTLTSDLDDEIFLTVLDPESRDELFLANTESFAPGSANGWTLNLVRDPDGGPPPFEAQLANGPRCSPD